jgi:hypothetical protein
VIQVDAAGNVNLNVPRNRNVNGVEDDKGYVIYAPAGPLGTLHLSSVEQVLPGQTPTAATNGTARLSAIDVISASSFQLTLDTSAVDLLGQFRDKNADSDNAIFKIDGGIDVTGAGFVDTNPGSVSYGFQQFTTTRAPGYFSTNGNGQYVQTIDTSKLSDGLHYITVRAFRHRSPNEPPIFTDFKIVIDITHPPRLTVTSFTAGPTGFTVGFNEPFVPADLTLYGSGLGTVADITLVGARTGPVSGSLIIDPSDTSITFGATGSGLSLANNLGPAVLPDDTYTVTLVSGVAGNGFLDALQNSLDGAGDGGHANYTHTFSTNYIAGGTPVLTLPDFARGPDATHAVQVPNDTGHGIPITLFMAAGVTDVTFTLDYNPALLTVTGAASGDATGPASSLTLSGSPTLIDATHASANFHYHAATAHSGTSVLGDIIAVVPSSAAGAYKAMELLSILAVAINQGAVKGAGGTSVHVNAYLGDVTGDGKIDALDLATVYSAYQGRSTGFAAYRLLDPVIVGDVAHDYSIDAGDVSDIAAYVVNLPTPMIPPLPTGAANAARNGATGLARPRRHRQ